MRRPSNKTVAIATSALVVGAAAVAIPAWAASSGGSESGSKAAGHPGSQLRPPPGFGAALPAAKGSSAPPAFPLTGKARERLANATQCLRSHAADIPGVHTSAHGFQIGPDVDRQALSRAAKACGAPPPPPRGARFEMRLGPPPKGRPKVPPRIADCLGGIGKRQGRAG